MIRGVNSLLKNVLNNLSCTQREPAPYTIVDFPIGRNRSSANKEIYFSTTSRSLGPIDF